MLQNCVCGLSKGLVRDGQQNVTKIEVLSCCRLLMLHWQYSTDHAFTMLGSHHVVQKPESVFSDQSSVFPYEMLEAVYNWTLGAGTENRLSTQLPEEAMLLLVFPQSVIYSFYTLTWIQWEWCWINLYPTHPANWHKVNWLHVYPTTFVCPHSNLYC